MRILSNLPETDESGIYFLFYFYQVCFFMYLGIEPQGRNFENLVHKKCDQFQGKVLFQK